jgi:tetratricopeptide (TPR) repeat protein
MKKILTILILTISTTTFGQTADEFLQSGIKKHKSKDLEGAINDYSNAIKEDNTLTNAYFYRAVCKQLLKDNISARIDFDKTIEINPKFAKAYYGRATISVTEEKFIDALQDLDKVIEIEPTMPNALVFRGQIRAREGNKKGACEDFTQAKANGDKMADKYLQQFCGNKQGVGESLMLHWPEEENWKIGGEQNDEQLHVLYLIHTNETLEKWTEFGNMTSAKGVTGAHVDTVMYLMFEQSKQQSPNAKLTFIEKDENAEHPWIIFTIENPSFNNDKTPESQLWYIVQGKEALYTNFRAIKQAVIPEELKIKWINFFKTGKVVKK